MKSYLIKNSANISEEDKVFMAIERLLNRHIVSVNDEASKYCYKTVSGEIGTVGKEFIQDRILAKLF